MRVHLVAVQAEIQPPAYRSAAAFRERVLALTRSAVEGLPEGEPRVVAFPEAFALPLCFWLEAPQEILQAPSATSAALALLRRRWPEALRLAIPSPAVFFHLRAIEVWPVYEQVFREAAQMGQAYVVAGSTFSPQVDWEPAQGYHRASRAVLNQTLLISPRGTVLSRVPKVNLTQDERRSFLSSGPLGGQVVQTQIGKLGVLICLDAFHERLVEWVDGQGAWLLVQPSANATRWDGPWSADARQVEKEVWLREGLAKKLAARENLRYGINPMLNGRFYTLSFEGQSGIYGPGAPIALAESPTGDALVRYTIDTTG
ncbi:MULTISPECIES: carbon-nitrogen hydrolase family protein [unclassified Meiothermus]|uniref:carbon-nitrogen hydrolase family protein n=1 Tax=unclassified Meiothermus TaxID=370471 RepID=UPI000D7BDE1D|nr:MULTISPECIES: carbon-nitrogen hydrolase family protein [unclassified Meiothermus]PZA06963.1 nitrilase [Meiothermus sp. Pnk-1]RYM38352.1 carbon-nitrogen hydrolase family protein [Meiothermus sp. PNK-Is4]